MNGLVGLWCLMSLSMIFSYIMAVSFIAGGNLSTRRKLPSCRKSLTNFYHIMLYQVHLAWAGFKLTTLGVIGTDCTGSWKSNYHTTTMVPVLWMQSCNNNTGTLKVVKDVILTVNSGNTKFLLVNLSFAKELLSLSVGFCLI